MNMQEFEKLVRDTSKSDQAIYDALGNNLHAPFDQGPDPEKIEVLYEEYRKTFNACVRQSISEVRPELAKRLARELEEMKAAPCCGGGHCHDDESKDE